MAETRREQPLLTGRQMLLLVALVLPIFFFLEGPIWRHPFAIDESILWSYAPIPVLVFAALVWLRKLTWAGFLVSTVCVTVIKYGITVTIASLLWALYGPPAPPPARPAIAASTLASETAERPAPSEIADARRGAIEGWVRDRDQRPIPGVLVYVSRGLERYVFDSPESAVEVTDDGREFTPRVAVSQERQPLIFRSVDRQLHTVLATTESGATAFNHPLLAGGAAAEFVPSRAYGWLRLGCTIHRGREQGSLLILGHPFFAWTGADGAFRLEHVPAGALELVARRPDGAVIKSELALERRSKMRVTLVVE